MSRRVTVRLSVAAAIFSLLVACGDEKPDSDDAASPVATGNPAGRALAHQIPGMTKIAATTQVYSEADGQPLEMDLYRPRGKDSAPVVLLLHGVTPDASPKDFGGFVGWGQALASSGVAAAVINYRADESGQGAGEEDIDAAIAHLRRDDRLDMSSWGLLTFSAGGPYGVRIAASAPSGLRAIGFFYARTEPSGGQPTRSTSLTSLLAERPDLAVFAAYGVQDNVPGVAESQRRLQAEVGREGSGQVTISVHPTGGHGFDVDADDTSAAIVRSAVEYFVSELRH